MSHFIDTKTQGWRVEQAGSFVQHQALYWFTPLVGDAQCLHQQDEQLGPVLGCRRVSPCSLASAGVTLCVSGHSPPLDGEEPWLVRC